MSRRTAVLIASSKFPDEPGLAALDAPERDVDALAKVLAAEAGGVYDEVLVLKNQPSHKVRVALNRKLRAAGKADQVLLYFSGHGKLDPTGRLCLTMTDTVLDTLEATALRVAELKDFLDVSRCRNVMLFLDCCYSGAAGKSFTRGAVEDQLQVTAHTAGICVMSAASAVQTALETPEDGLGVFTRCVVEGIQSGEADLNGDGLVTFDELFDYVHRRVIAEGHQRPQKWVFQADGDLLVARTGRDLWEKTKQSLRERILALAASQDLPGEVVGQSLELLAIPRGEQTERQRIQIKLLEDLAGDRAKLASFMMGWMRLTGTVPATTPAAAPPPAQFDAGARSGRSPEHERSSRAPAAEPAAPHKVGPGRWQIECRAYGVVPFQKYTLDLRPDGSIEGHATYVAIASRVTGRWTFHDGEAMLILDLTMKALTARLLSGNPTLKISITGHEGNVLKGRHLVSLTFFTLARVD